MDEIDLDPIFRRRSGIMMMGNNRGKKGRDNRGKKGRDNKGKTKGGDNEGKENGGDNKGKNNGRRSSTKTKDFVSVRPKDHQKATSTRVVFGVSVGS